MESVGVANFLFMILGFVITAQAQDCAPPDGGPNRVLVDADIGLTVFPEQSKATFSCVAGYTASGGSKFVICAGGTWSVLTLTCERKSCGSPGELHNGDIKYVDGDVLFGHTITFTCNKGYNLVGSSKNGMHCEAKGWNGRLPTCEVVTCLPPPDLTNGRFSDVKESYNFGELVTYKCDGALILNGSVTLTCSENETFMPDPPTCIKVQCENIENARRIGGAPPPYGYKHHVTFKCNPGHGNEETHHLDCGLDSQWLPALPKCEPNKVPPSTTTLRPPTIKTQSPSTTTLRPPTIKTPSTTTKTVTASGSGTTWWQSWWFILLAIITCVAITACGCRYFGCLSFIKNKKGYRGYSGNVAAKDEEGEL
ncbi:C4b-binding protein alpha chain-like isoform X3 [Genypterus blacodes]|uniref:C4b-binding protein alpha chain-like isoform X3 n=1 Tax=Genypterus blacodes TaxID=154954 RepID=UPI003F76F3D3